MQKTDLYLLLKNRRKDRSLDSKRNAAFTRSLVIGVLSILLILLSGVLLTSGILYASIARDLPSLDILPVLLNPVDGELLQPTTITDRTGQTTLFTLETPGIERRYLAVNPEKKDHFNPQLVRAVVSKLDPTFWENPGYSLENWQDPEPATIAERLVSELLLWDEPLSTTRAIRMRLLAAQVVTRYGRTQVLEWYLNSANFGHLAYGAESASQVYFEKSAQDLSLAEAAMLSVLIDAPALNPLDAPAAALDMQRQFLAKMAQTLIITTDDFTIAVNEKLLIRESVVQPESLVPEFTRRLILALEKDFPNNRIERGGLVIKSTLDLNLQTQFVCTVETQLNRLQGSSTLNAEDCPTALLLPTQAFSNITSSSLISGGVILYPASGEVLAYVEPMDSNGLSETNTKYEPGSLLTPFVALAGFARGLSPATLEWDVPSSSTDSTNPNNNPDGHWHGATTIRASIANDYLIPIVDVANQVGTSNVWHLASALGMTSLADVVYDESILLSGETSSLLEVAAAYATLANSGVRSGDLDAKSGEIELSYILTVRSTTNRLLEDNSTPDSSVILSQPLSYLINNVLSDESARWPTLGYPNPLEIGQTTAAKLGVASSRQQVWTVGYTPERLVLIWMGNSEKNLSPQELDPLMTAGVWHALIKQSTLGLPVIEWGIPEGVTTVKVCVPSGMLPSSDCPNTMEDIFLIGNEPTRVDTLYETIKVNRETGQRATVFTDPTLIEEQLFINVPSAARKWAIEAGLAVAPSGYDAIPAVQSDPEVNISSPIIFSPVSETITIEGTATGADFANYSVQIGEGINPSSWIQIGTGSSIVTNGTLAEWDTTGLDGLYAIRLTVVGQDQSLRTSTIQVTVDNTSPLVNITYPAADQIVESINNQVTLQAEVQDSAGILQVEWWLDGELASTQADSPYLYLMTAESGKHTLQLTALDNAGNLTTTNEIEFTVSK